jgi:predicted metallopeptidase
MWRAALTVNVRNLTEGKQTSEPVSAEFLSQNTKIKIHEIINFPAVFFAGLKHNSTAGDWEGGAEEDILA